MRVSISALAATLALAALLAGCAGDQRRTGPVDARVAHSVAAVHLDPATATVMLNAYRASHGLGPVRLDPPLTAMAQRQANAMVATDTLSHDAGGSFSSRLAAAAVDTARAGENLGGGYMSTEEAFTGWRNSSGHNVNLLMPQATRFGIALAKDPGTGYRVFWAMVVAAEPERRTAGPAGVLMSPSFGPVIMP